jgi:hypothetical protein
MAKLPHFRFGATPAAERPLPVRCGFANLDVKQILLNTTASMDAGVIQVHTALNPLVAGMGIGYRF